METLSRFRVNWCTKKGLQDRKKGMYSIEKRGRKRRVCVFFSFSALIYFVLAGFFTERTMNAVKINEDFSNEQMIKNAYKI